MTQTYLFRCACGRDLEISERQAGQALVCDCGKTSAIPPLRQIRGLPPASTTTTTAARRDTSGWSLSRGIMFSLGTFLLLSCLPAFAYVGWQRSQIDLTQPDLANIEYDFDIDALSPLDTLELWNFITTQNLFRNDSPMHILNRERAARLRWLMTIAGVLAGGGLISVLASLYGPRRSGGQ